MGLWRDILRVLGLSSDARVHISAPGIDVVITGEPEKVRSLLGVVKYELERSARWRERLGPALAAGQAPQHPGELSHGALRAKKKTRSARGSQYVQPTELDEMDSPYALPDALVMPVEESTGEHEPPRAARPQAQAPQGVQAGPASIGAQAPIARDGYLREPATPVLEAYEDSASTGVLGPARAHAVDTSDGPGFTRPDLEPEATSLDARLDERIEGKRARDLAPGGDRQVRLAERSGARRARAPSHGDELRLYESDEPEREITAILPQPAPGQVPTPSGPSAMPRPGPAQATTRPPSRVREVPRELEPAALRVARAAAGEGDPDETKDSGPRGL